MSDQTDHSEYSAACDAILHAMDGKSIPANLAALGYAMSLLLESVPVDHRPAIMTKWLTTLSVGCRITE